MLDIAIRSATVQGEVLTLVASGIAPGGVADFIIPLACLPDRRLREAMAPCAACLSAGRETVHVPLDERGSHVTRVQEAHLATDCTTADGTCGTVSTCRCLTCDCCQAALRLLLQEHFARLNPDRVMELDAAVAQRLTRIGGVPGRVWCDGCGQAEAPDHHLPQKVAVDVTRTLAGIVL